MKQTHRPPRSIYPAQNRHMRRRTRVLAGLVAVLCFGGLLARLFTLQILDPSGYANRAAAQQLRDTTLPAARGEIYSADGVTLAASKTCWTIRASPRELADELVQPAAKALSEILDIDYDATLQKLSKRTSNDCLLRRRVDAERLVRFAGRSGLRASILRVPGIYAPNREGGTPEARLRRGTPVLVPADDVYTNHIHADDLARACVAALWRGAPQRVYHASDDSDLKMGDYFDLAADLYGLPRPPRITRAQAQTDIAPMLLSFMSESRRMDNTRLHRELRVRLRYPTVVQGLRS